MKKIIGIGFHTQLLVVLGMGFGCGYETQSPKPRLFGCAWVIIDIFL